MDLRGDALLVAATTTAIAANATPITTAQTPSHDRARAPDWKETNWTVMLRPARVVSG